MINKFGYKLLLALLISYTLTLFAYLFWVVNVLSHRSCILILGFSIIGTVIDYAVLIAANKYQSRLGVQTVSDISVITLFYTLMHFFTVIFARNILDAWQYALCQVLFLVLYLVSVLPKLLNSLKINDLEEL